MTRASVAPWPPPSRPMTSEMTQGAKPLVRDFHLARTPAGAASREHVREGIPVDGVREGTLATATSRSTSKWLSSVPARRWEKRSCELRVTNYEGESAAAERRTCGRAEGRRKTSKRRNVETSGRRGAGTQGHRDAGTQGRRDTGTKGRRDRGSDESREQRIRTSRNAETSKRRNVGTEGGDRGGEGG
jgi:hypothetical protein